MKRALMSKEICGCGTLHPTNENMCGKGASMISNTTLNAIAACANIRTLFPHFYACKSGEFNLSLLNKNIFMLMYFLIYLV